MVHPWHLREAARNFRQGNLIAYPTEAVYGLGCNPLDWHAVERLLALKQRSLSKGLILIAADFEQLRPFISLPSAEIMEPIFATWPGPVTWLLPAAPDLPFWLTGKHQTLAVRVTAHPIAADLCRACDSPLVSTSANISSRPPTRSALTLRRHFKRELGFILNGQVGSLKQPTPIRDALGGTLIRC